MYAYQENGIHEDPLGNYLRGKGVRGSDLSVGGAGAHRASSFQVGLHRSPLRLILFPVGS